MPLRIHTPQLRGRWQCARHQMHLIAAGGGMEEVTLFVGATTWVLYGRPTGIPMATFRSSGWGLGPIFVEQLEQYKSYIYIYIYSHLYIYI